MSVNEVKVQRAAHEFEVRGSGHPGSRTFALGDEDHTLGNALRHVLANDARVGFAGYSVPHPSEPVVCIRVQTAEPPRRRVDQEEGDQERMTAIDALKEACTTLSEQCSFVLEKLEEALPEVREDRIRMEGIAEADGYDNDRRGGVEEEEVEDDGMIEGDDYGEEEGYDD